MKILGFAFCRLGHLRNLRICDSGMSLRMCGFAICELKKFGKLEKILISFSIIKNASLLVILSLEAEIL
jgi:hypothetical protein